MHIFAVLNSFIFVPLIFNIISVFVFKVLHQKDLNWKWCENVEMNCFWNQLWINKVQKTEKVNILYQFIKSSYKIHRFYVTTILAFFFH